MDERNLFNVVCETTDWGLRIELETFSVEDDNYINVVEGMFNSTGLAEASSVLIDARKVVRCVSLSKIYDSLIRNKRPSCFGKRIAILSSPDTDEIGSDFIEDVCASRGVALKYFVEESVALTWLLNS